MKNKLVLFLCILALAAIGIFGNLYLSKQQVKKQIQSQSPQLVMITNSGSTNFAGYTITINKDGSGLLQYDSRPNDQNSNRSKVFSKGTFQVSQLQIDLIKVSDVSKIPTKSNCLKSVSFGSRTTISYNNKTSGDISCSQDDGSGIYQALNTDISQIQQQALK